MEKMEKMKEMKERTSRKAGRRTAVLVLAVILGAGFYGCEDPNAESAPAPRSNKTVDRLEVLQDPYRALYEGDRLAEKLREFNPPAERVPRYSGYLEGEFLNDEHLVDLGPRNRLILHGLKVRIHHADGSSQDVEFPRDWQSNVMRQLGTDGRGMLFHWPNGKDWMTVELDGKSARFNTPFYPLQQVMIDVDATAALSPAPRKFYTMLESGMETATSGASGTVVRPKLVVKGYYGPGRGWLEIPEEVEVGTTFQPGYLGYLGPQDIRVLVYRGMLNENGVREAMPSSTSTSILTPNGSNYDDTYTIYTLPVFSFD
ncbi:MAG: hypothetical protein LBD24_05485, partial [Spirochaetaceae bacterium]|nr:hypothetical protein [Spirochaetaceae bacterium]